VNLAFFRFATEFLFKDFSRYALLFFLFFVIVFMAFALIFTTDSIKQSLKQNLENQPDIQVIAQKGGYDSFATDEYLLNLEKIRGVEDVKGRVYGRYFFEQEGVYFDIVGVDFFSPSREPLPLLLSTRVDEKELIEGDFFYAGKWVREIMLKFNYKDFFNFYTPDSGVLKLNFAGVLEGDSIINSNIIVTDMEKAREILGLDSNEFSDIVLFVPNENEIPNIVTKIKTKYPFAKTVLKTDNEAFYDYLFYYKGGIFLVFYIVVLLAFFILLYQKSSSISGKERKEIAVFRAVGWSISDVIKFFMLINSIVAIGAFLGAFVLAYIFVFWLDAPVFINIFFSKLTPDLHPIINIDSLFAVFLFTVVPFLASVILPSWKASVSEVSEVLK